MLRKFRIGTCAPGVVLDGRAGVLVGDPETGLVFIESALVRAKRLTATERAMLHLSRARDLAKLGEVQGALSAVGVADEEFSHAHPADDPPWMASYNEAHHTGFSGSALRELGMHGQLVAETRTRLSTGRDPRRLAQPHAKLTEIAELRHRIGTVVAASRSQIRVTGPDLRR